MGNFFAFTLPTAIAPYFTQKCRTTGLRANRISQVSSVKILCLRMSAVQLVWKRNRVRSLSTRETAIAMTGITTKHAPGTVATAAPKLCQAGQSRRNTARRLVGVILSCFCECCAVYLIFLLCSVRASTRTTCLRKPWIECRARDLLKVLDW